MGISMLVQSGPGNEFIAHDIGPFPGLNAAVTGAGCATTRSRYFDLRFLLRRIHAKDLRAKDASPKRKPNRPSLIHYVYWLPMNSGLRLDQALIFYESHDTGHNLK